MKSSSPSPSQQPAVSSRREFIRQSSRIAAGTALAGVAIPHVHSATDHSVRLALIGCGGRGSGALANAMHATALPVKLVAMADLFENRMQSAHRTLSTNFSDRVDVPAQRQFIGFDAFKHAIDSLRPGSGDIAMLTGYAGFRPGQLAYAVKKGVNVFMEKSFACDPPGVRRVIQAGADAEKKGLKIAAGLMCRHSRNRQELIKRIRAGELGDIQLIRAYRMGPSGPLGPRPAATGELEWQLRNFTKFLWVSGGLFAEMDIHQIDELCWIKDAWPVSAHGIGGRVANSTDRSQNLDSFSIEWTFADGTKAYDVVRYIPKCFSEFATYIHGTKKAAQFSGNIHAGTVHTYKDQRCEKGNIEWAAPDEEFTPHQAQWNDFLDAIRNDVPFNQADRAAKSNLADIMGRAAVHMGRVITWDEAMASKFQFCPNIDSLAFDSAPPIIADAEGRYPVPIPGEWSEI
ncbi:MAG: Gfo/Idh/MocA family oxidoreductase [Chthoniobacteraceae bacterium]